MFQLLYFTHQAISERCSSLHGAQSSASWTSTTELCWKATAQKKKNEYAGCASSGSGGNLTYVCRFMALTMQLQLLHHHWYVKVGYPDRNPDIGLAYCQCSPSLACGAMFARPYPVNPVTPARQPPPEVACGSIPIAGRLLDLRVATTRRQPAFNEINAVKCKRKKWEPVVHLQGARHDKGEWLAAAMLLLAPAGLPAAPSCQNRTRAHRGWQLAHGRGGGFGVRSGCRKDNQRRCRESLGRRVRFGKAEWPLRSVGSSDRELC